MNGLGCCLVFHLNTEELGMEKPEKGGVLLKDKEYVKFVQLLRKAERDGRLDGYPCPLCGSRYVDREEAEGCCRSVIS
jgi:hypothetical protein